MRLIAESEAHACVGGQMSTNINILGRGTTLDRKKLCWGRDDDGYAVWLLDHGLPWRFSTKDQAEAEALFGSMSKIKVYKASVPADADAA